ncbi:MAG TPA: DNA repair protein RecN [Gemmatimonadaceae bacterium]|nr:DNA repair protein RecN [Gemmatimonadaceae bacterium]
MLLELRIRDLAIIRQVTLPLAPAFNVLSGETGAGKSIIVGALTVLLGERASADMVRSGADRATVEGVFDVAARRDVLDALDERGLEHEDGTLVLKREIAPGRARAWINGTPVTASVLSAIGRLLVTVHGQHEAQTLLDTASQRRWLDAAAGALGVARDVASRHAAVLAARAAIAERRTRQREAEQRADFLRHVLEEIEKAQLQPGEDERLQEELQRLEHADELRALAEQVARRLDGGDDDENGGLIAQLATLQRLLAQLRRIDGGADRLAQLADEAAYALDELSRDASTYAAGVDLDPERLVEAQRRRDVVFRLLKKYGPAMTDVLAEAASAREALRLVDDAEEDMRRLHDALQVAQESFARAASELTTARRRTAQQLAETVTSQLPALGLPEGRFMIALPPRDEPGPTGSEEVEFRVALNAGHDARPLSRVASGGELSRVMLALASTQAAQDSVPTLVFDEIDAGIGGRVGQKVGDALRALASRHQVFAITHLPQLASRAHHHIVVEKGTADGVTSTDVRVVTGEERALEVARMLGGDPGSSVSVAHARELLQGGAAPGATATTPATAATRTSAARATKKR